MVHVEVTVSTKILNKKYHRLSMTVVYYIKPKLYLVIFFNTSLLSKYPPSPINRLSLVIHVVWKLNKILYIKLLRTANIVIVKFTLGTYLYFRKIQDCELFSRKIKTIKSILTTYLYYYTLYY